MAHFLLIHGMFHGGWCWDRVADELRHRGHSVDAPDLTGCGDDCTPAHDVSLERWANDVAERLHAAPEPAILVGHSRGGLVVSAAAERAPERVRAAVYIAALMLPDGGRARDLPALTAKHGLAADIAPVTLSADRTTMLPPQDPAETYYAGCSATDAEHARLRLRPEPIAPMREPVSISAERSGRVPRFYVETLRDAVLPHAAQRAMLAESPGASVLTMDTGHFPLLSHAVALVEMLSDVAVLTGAGTAAAA